MGDIYQSKQIIWMEVQHNFAFFPASVCLAIIIQWTKKGPFGLRNARMMMMASDFENDEELIKNQEAEDQKQGKQEDDANEEKREDEKERRGF